MSARTRAAKLIKRFEGCRLAAYPDSGGIWTIGWGRTARVVEGDACTQEEADAWLLADMQVAEDGITFVVPGPLSESMRAALISFAYNIGGKHFRESEAVAALRERRYLDVPKHMLEWRLVAGEPSLGLLRRRIAEAALFLEDPLPDA